MKNIISANMPKLIASVFLVAILMPLHTWASEEDLLGIAVDSPVSGWSTLPDSTTYGHGGGLADIYNGGYQAFTDAGVEDALRRIYVNGEEYVEVTVHGMKSPSFARKFLSDRYRMETEKEAPNTPGWNSFTASGPGGATAYVVQGKYCIVVVAYSGGEKGKEQAALFVKSLGERAGKHP
jgi:hypothetical protein